MCYVESKAHVSPDGQHGWQDTTFPCQIVQSGGRCPSMMSPKIQPPDSWLNPQLYPPFPMERGRTMQKPRNTRPLLRQSDIYPRRGLPERQERVTPYHTSVGEPSISVPRRRGSRAGLNSPDAPPYEWPAEQRDPVTSYRLGRRPSVAPTTRRRRGSTSPYPQRSVYQRPPSGPVYANTRTAIEVMPNSSYRSRRPSSQTGESVKKYHDAQKKPPPSFQWFAGAPKKKKTTRGQASFKDECFGKMASDSIADACGWQVGREKFLWKGEPITSTVVMSNRGFLGRGTVGLVEEVKIVGYGRSIARKRIILATNKKSAERDRTDIRSEIDNLKRLDHAHIIKILGCYEEQYGRAQSICALMYPAGDEDLGHFLYEECHSATVVQKRWIKMWFHCLASALAYMHKQKVHHEDIKPSNIIHRGKDVFFTDFSSSRRLEAGQDTSTESPAKATRLFAAPEAMSSDDSTMHKHGSKTDVYSLGLVYVEMIAVLSGQDVTEMRDQLFEGTQQVRQYHRVIDTIPDHLGWEYDDAWDHCLKQMLHPTRQLRPSAQEVTVMLDKERRLRPSKVSCTCRGTQESNGVGNANRRPSVAIHNSLSTKHDPNLTRDMPASSEISIVVRSGKVVVTDNRGAADHDETTLTEKPYTKPATPFEEPATRSVADGSVDNNHKMALRLDRDHVGKDMDDEFVWVPKGPITGEIFEDALNSANINGRKTGSDNDHGKSYSESESIDSIMRRAWVTRQEAVKALEDHDGDVIEALMSFVQ